MSIRPVEQNSKMLYLQAKYQFEKAMKKFEDGTIKSEPQLIQTVFQAFQDFFTSVGKPHMIPRYVTEHGPAWSEDYNEMLDEIRADLELLFEEANLLGKALYTDFNYNVMQHDMLQKEFEEVLDKMRDLEIYAGYSKDGIIRIGRDDFLNTNKIDFDRISGVPLEITKDGVTLAKRGEPRNVAKNAKVTIVTGNKGYSDFLIGADSNGFPGNNTEITVIADPLISSGNMYSFVGREDNHGNYGAVIDGNPNTWFEYEKVNLREHEKVRVAKNLGWKYQVYDDKTIEYVGEPENGVLKLHLQIVLDKVEIINQINIRMYTPPNYGAKPAIVKNILISDGVEAPRSILKESKQDTDYTFIFPPMKAKVISILFEQPEKYYTDIGHIYYEQKTNIQNPKDYVFDTVTKQYKPKYATRVEGPLINIEELGVKVDMNKTDVNVYYPMKTAEDSKGYSLQNIINNLTTRVDLSTVDMGVERFEGWRYCIGIRDIEILSCEYETTGEIVTKPFYFDKPLTKISLSVHETLPELFANNPTIKYDWIQYFISIDDGLTWHPITPLEHELLYEDQPPKIYTIGKVSEEEAISEKYGYLESEYPVYSIRLKILFTRPEEGEYDTFAGETEEKNYAFMTPTLKKYLFQVETYNDESDSQESKKQIVNWSNLEQPPSSSDDDNEYGNNDGTGGSDNGNEGGSGGSGSGGSGESDTGDDKLKVTITNNVSMWCSDQDFILKGYAQGPNDIIMIELYINNQLFATVEGNGTQQEFSFSIPKQNFQPDQILTLTVKAYDFETVGQASKILQIIDCTGMPEEDRPSDETNQEHIKVSIDNKISTLCVCNHLSIVGTITSGNAIQGYKLFINSIEIDPMNIGEPPNELPCEESNWPASVTNVISSNVISFSWTIPYWKLHELGFEEGSIVEVTVAANDEQEVGSDNFTFTITACGASGSEGGSGDGEGGRSGNDSGPPVNGCYILDTVIIQYYHEEEHRIAELEIGADMLPFEFNNGGGTWVTVGWSDSFKGVTVMITNGFNESGSAFQLNAIGVRYRDFYDNQQIKWAYNILEQSEGNRNLELMLGNPEERDSSTWVDEIQNGNYSNAPSLGGINDYVSVVFGNEWATNSCGIGQEFNIEEHQKDPDAPPGEDKERIRDCKLLKKIVFQYYNDAKQLIGIYQIDLNENYKALYTVETKNGLCEILVGWYDLFKGILFNIKTASGENNILLTALGAVYEDEYGDLRTTWIESIRYKTYTVKNSDLMLGKPKSLDECPWIEEVNQGDYANAPVLGKQGATLVGLISEEVKNSMCPVQYVLDNHPEMPPLDQTPPTIVINSLPNPYCYQQLNPDQTLTISGTVQDDNSIEGWEIYKDSQLIASGTNTNFSANIPIALPSKDPKLDIYPDMNVAITVKARDIFHNESTQTVVITLKDCTPHAYTEGNITVNAEILYETDVNIDLGNFMTQWTEWNQNPSDPGNWSVVNNAGRTELTNLVNQSTRSAWYNKAHLANTDYQIQATIQSRGWDDDMMGLFFRVNENASGQVIGFYSVEFDGLPGSHVNGPGFRILKWSYNGSWTRTVLAENTSWAWTSQQYKVYRITVSVLGNQISAKLEVDPSTGGSSAAPSGPFTFTEIGTLYAEDNTYTQGAWGPMTASNPSTFFWDLKMSGVQSITANDDSNLQQVIWGQGLNKPTNNVDFVDIPLTNAISSYFQTHITNAINNRGISPSKVIDVRYKIVSDTLPEDVRFEPYDVNEKQTYNDNAVIIAKNVKVYK